MTASIMKTKHFPANDDESAADPSQIDSGTDPNAFATWSPDPAAMVFAANAALGLSTSSLVAQATTAVNVVSHVAASSVLVSTGGLAIDLLFDAAATAAPAAFRTSIEQAATLLSQTISDKITVNINIDYSGSGGGAFAGPDASLYESYSTVRSDLINNATPGDTSFNALPSGTSIQGQSQVQVWNSELKLFGLLGANAATDDGSATFATDIPSNDLVGVALHELTHALGRVPAGPTPDIFDLFRFTNTGTRLFSSTIPSIQAYFSVDNGSTKLADYGQKSDPSDFLNSGVQGPNDPFNEFYTGSTSQILSNADLEQLDVLGFHVANSSNLTLVLGNDTGASASDKLTNNPTLTGLALPSKTITLSDNGNPAGSTIANAAGVWTFTPSLTDAQHTITASEVNGTGQTVTASLTFWLATKAPTISASESVSGQTAQTSNTITVFAAAESVGANAISGVEIFDGAADIGAAALLAGSWTLTAQNLLPGAHNFTAKATDLAGNVAAFTLPQVVVTGATPSNSYTLAAFTFAGSGVTDTRPKGINDSGEIVGYYIDGRADSIGADGLTYYEHGFYSTVNGGLRQYTSIEDPDIDAQDGNASGPDRTRAFSVNNVGDIVGWYSQDETGLSSAGAPYVLPDAGFIESVNWPGNFGKLGFSALNDFGTHALGINASDQIVGYYDDGSGNQHGFLRNFTGYGVRGAYLSFDFPNSIDTVAEGINDGGQIVGFYQTADGAYHGYSYNSVSSAFTPIDFNGATGTEALGVNNSGVIVGEYFDSAGNRHGFVRDSAGQFTTIDDPNAGSGGTLVGGINNEGEIVGWYTGTDGHDYGFTGTAPSTGMQFLPFTHQSITTRTTTQVTSGGVTDTLQSNGGYAFLDVSLPGSFISGSASYQNITGNGRTDLIMQTPDHTFYFASGSGTGGTGGLGIPTVGLTQGGITGFIPHQTQFVDINGDGRTDSIFQGLDNRFWVNYGTATGFTGAQLVAQEGGPFNPMQTQYADVNGDGKADLIFQGLDNRFWIDYGTATGFSGAQFAAHEGGPFNPAQVQYADVTGDGKADLIYQGIDNRFWISDGTGSGFGPAVLGLTHGGPFIAGEMKYADVNGDGKADAVFQGADNRVWLSLSNGTTFNAPVLAATLPQDAFDTGKVQLVDMNGDGKADLMYQTASNQIWEFLSTGTGFAAGKLVANFGGTYAPGSVGYGDLNGDHLGDIVYQDPSNNFRVSLQNFDWFK